LKLFLNNSYCDSPTGHSSNGVVRDDVAWKGQLDWRHVRQPPEPLPNLHFGFKSRRFYYFHLKKNQIDLDEGDVVVEVWKVVARVDEESFGLVHVRIALSSSFARPGVKIYSVRIPVNVKSIEFFQVYKFRG